MTKPWQTLDAAAVAQLPGQLGVFQFADAAGEIVFIGCADARSRFGLRSALEEAWRACEGATAYRIEVTTAYTTRHLELLMAYQAALGRLPVYNTKVPALGRLSPG
ncbi:MAG: hypothetical protein HC809_06320 [Gammaproteobacteria bacterium]|nr:hypothetical protein [Gammaproteobacteria bacterium]